ncbi:MAG: O-methyltransferase [Propylenella sp.]
MTSAAANRVFAARVRSEAGVGPLEDLIRRAWQTGKGIDLSGIQYGKAIRDGKDVYVQSPSTYYPFLAGLVRETGATRIVEIGTNCAGSTRAMARGFVGGGHIVTVDISDDSDPFLAGYDNITKMRGDANSIEVIEQVVAHCGSPEIDIVYIDAAHSCMPTLLNYCIYSTLLRPRFAVLDDITLYETMLRMWRLVEFASGPDAIDAATVVPDIRPQKPSPGFGIVRLR